MEMTATKYTFNSEDYLHYLRNGDIVTSKNKCSICISLSTEQPYFDILLIRSVNNTTNTPINDTPAALVDTLTAILNHLNAEEYKQHPSNMLRVTGLHSFSFDPNSGNLLLNNLRANKHGIQVRLNTCTSEITSGNVKVLPSFENETNAMYYNYGKVLSLIQSINNIPNPGIKTVYYYNRDINKSKIKCKPGNHCKTCLYKKNLVNCVVGEYPDLQMIEENT